MQLTLKQFYLYSLIGFACQEFVRDKVLGGSQSSCLLNLNDPHLIYVLFLLDTNPSTILCKQNSFLEFKLHKINFTTSLNISILIWKIKTLQTGSPRWVTIYLSFYHAKSQISKPSILAIPLDRFRPFSNLIFILAQKRESKISSLLARFEGSFRVYRRTELTLPSHPISPRSCKSSKN